jgi:large subunit ribosomal protein L32
MAVPKKKKSKSCSAMHKSHNALTAMVNTVCPKCGEKKRPHHVCGACGYYAEKNVLGK